MLWIPNSVSRRRKQDEYAKRRIDSQVTHAILLECGRPGRFWQQYRSAGGDRNGRHENFENELIFPAYGKTLGTGRALLRGCVFGKAGRTSLSRSSPAII